MNFKIWVRQKDNPKSKWMVWAAFQTEPDRNEFEAKVLSKNPTWETRHYNPKAKVIDGLSGKEVR